MSFVRGGPKILIVEPDNREAFVHYVKTHFNLLVDNSAKSFEDLIAGLQCEQTVLYISEHAKENVSNLHLENCISISASAQEFLMHMINSGNGGLIKFIRKAPRMVIMKVVGDMSGTVSNVVDDFNAVVEPTRTVFNMYSNGTVICFTKANINKKIVYSDLFEQSIYTESHFSDVIERLDHQALKYISRNLNNGEWFELLIKIHDNNGAHKFHYDRLVYVFDKLGLGIVLKEGWSEHIERLFFSVGYYSLSFFTYLKPEEIKKITFALEFMENGERIVDFDVFHNRKKIHWDSIRLKQYASKAALSLHYRQALYKSLDITEVEKIVSMEDYIFATR